MHFHLPKPLHGWREFAGEVGIIVIGVLIALGAEQLVQDWHWRGEVRQTDQRIRAEVAANLANAYERLAIDSCLRPRLAELRDQLLKVEPNWPGSRARLANDVYKSGFPGVYRTPNGTWDQGAWTTALNGEVLGHFDAERVQRLGSLFDTVVALRRNQSEEVEVAGELGDLAFAGPITSAERRSNLKLVARLDSLEASSLYLSRQLIDNARLAGIAPDPTAMRENLTQQRGYRGSCVHAPDLAAL